MTAMQAPSQAVLDLSIVIVNWNTGILLKQCLDSILVNSAGICYEIVVIDNASSDDSMHGLLQMPAICYVHNATNVGFARANNQGFFLTEGRYILMLNPDTVILPNALQEMIRFMDEHRDVGALGPKLLDSDYTLQPSCSHFPSLRSVAMESFGLNRLMPKQRFFARSFMTNWGHDVIMQVDQPSGACLMLRGVALKQVNYLDERFFVYLEEVDLCYRLVKQGWKVYFLPLAQVIHYGGQSSSKNLDVRIVERYRSLLRYFSKHSPLWKIVLIRMLIVFQMLLRITTLPFIRSKLSTDTAKELTILGLSSYYVRVIRSCFRSQYSI